MGDRIALIVDDEPDIRELLEITLGRMGIDTIAARDLGEARRVVDERAVDLCLTDMRLPDGNGIDFVRHVQACCPEVPVAMITAHGNMESAIEALKAGAFDFVSKPVDLQVLRDLVNTALRLDGRTTARRAEPGPKRLIGRSQVMEATRAQIRKLARSQAPIYISGESGTGKELVARMIHEQGPRADEAFVPVNCGAIPSELMESEFFGHIKGSFTGAIADKPGLFQSAQGGTLFLDEVAELPLPMQVKLLRAIQEKSIRPVGAQAENKTDVRILSATHKDLDQLVSDGVFRQDLYYRINVIQIHVPALRERREDIGELAAHILDRLCAEGGVPRAELSDEAAEDLAAYRFPGNVRELENVLERALTMCEADVIQAADLRIGRAPPAPERGAESTAQPQAAGRTGQSGLGAGNDLASAPHPLEQGTLETQLETLEKERIVAALEKTRWNKTAAARELGITFRALRYRLKKLGLD